MAAEDAVADPVGAKFYVGPSSQGANLPTTTSAYADLVYVEVDNVETIPAFGAVANVSKYTPLNTGKVKKKKGSVDSGDPEVVCFQDNSDPGQLAMVAARSSKWHYAFKVEVPDAMDDSAANTVYYFHALVTSCPSEPGSADNILRRRFGLAISGDILEVPTVAPA